MWPWIVGGSVLFLIIIVGIAGALSSSPSPAGSTGAVPTGPGLFAPSTQDAPLAPARTVTAREWQLIAKDPQSYTGDRVIVYGQIVQFDSVTGTNTFRASVDGVVHEPEYGYADYDTNTVLTGDVALLTSLVQGDLFKADVTVGQPLSYETTLGGTTTVPSLVITKIDVIGHV